MSVFGSLCQYVRTVQIHQNRICIADLPTEKIRHLINKWKGGTRQEAAQKKILFYWDAVECSELGGY